MARDPSESPRPLLPAGPHPEPAPRDHRLAARSAERLRGAFYTGEAATLAMAAWALRSGSDEVLEPSFGGGAFLRAAREVCARRGWGEVRLHGAELIGAASDAAVREGLITGERAFRGDFLSLTPFPVDAVLGNPPYVRLRHLPPDQAARAKRVAADGLGAPMDPSGSVWMPFVLHALSFLRPGGRLALVLPFDLTYVKYARPLWRVLGETFRELGLVRVHERLFPEILQDVVVLLADGFGGRTGSVRYCVIDAASSFPAAATRGGRSVELTEVCAGQRAFMRALLDPDLLALLGARIAPRTTPVRELCAFNIGYVSGHKEFFHPSPDFARTHGLPVGSLRGAVTTSRQLTGAGLRTSVLPARDTLFLPPADPTRLTEGERRYLARGVELGVHLRYKCRIRSPWYLVPGVRVPGLILSVFSERPVVLLNDAGLVATNSLLCGTLRRGTPEAFVAGWYTSLTPLLCELEVHSLGGGILILIPGEVGRVRVPEVAAPARDHLAEVHRRLAAGDVRGAYRVGDAPVLCDLLGLSDREIALLDEGAATLRHWRTSVRGQDDPIPAQGANLSAADDGEALGERSGAARTFPRLAAGARSPQGDSAAGR